MFYFDIDRAGVRANVRVRVTVECDYSKRGGVYKVRCTVSGVV